MVKASLLVSVLLAACSSSSETGTQTSALTAADYDDTAQTVATSLVGDGNGGEVDGMATSATIALGGMPLGFSLTGSGEIDGNRLGLDYSLSIACEDANGVALTTCTDATDLAKVDVAWSGAVDTSHFDASVDREGAWTLDGLQSNAVRFNGASTFSVDATLLSIFRPGAQSSFSLDAAATYDAVALDTQTYDAIGGRATLDLAAHKVVTGTNADVDKTFEVHADVEFHADRTATLTLDDDVVYSLNLATGIVVRL